MNDTLTMVTRIASEDATLAEKHDAFDRLVAAFQDISNLRSLENTLQENLRETISLYEGQRSLSQAETLNDIVDSIMRQVITQHPSNAYIILTQLEDQAPYIANFLRAPIVDIDQLTPLLTHEARLISKAFVPLVILFWPTIFPYGTPQPRNSAASGRKP